MFLNPKLCGLVCCCSWWTAALSAQESPSKEQAALVDGLLELLNEPAPKKNLSAPASPVLPEPDNGTASNNLEPAASHPLHAVRENMLTAADYLSKGYVNQQTQQLQSQIVLRLDELIEQLEQANPPQQSQQSQQPQQTQQSQSTAGQETPTAQTQPQKADTAPPGPAEKDAAADSGASDQSPATPGQKGTAANPTVDLVDPKTLQQDVWGQLPEQVRKQMQSRMVERFLPSYRQQIEAYFQALIEGPKSSSSN